MNVKKGDLAIIIKSFAGNEGKIVEVVEFLGSDPKFKGMQFGDGLGSCWLVRSDKQTLNIGASFPKLHMDEQVGVTSELPIPDAWLRPVSGLPDRDDITTDQPIKEHA